MDPAQDTQEFPRQGDPPRRPGRLSRRAVLILVVVGVLIGFGGGAITVAFTHNSPSSSPNARAVGTKAARASSPGTTTASPTASHSPTPRARASATTPAIRAACDSPASCGFPNASNTGPGPASLTEHSGNISIRDNGVVISGWNLTGSLDVYANNVTIINSRITSSNWWGVNLRAGHTGLRVLHSYITAAPGKGPDNGGEDYAVSNSSGGSVEVGWCDLSVFGNTISTGHGYIHDNYVHDLVPFINHSGYYQHTDAVIANGNDTQGLHVEHNTLLNPIDVDHGASAAIGLYPDDGPVTDITVKDNWLAGGAYTLYGGGAGAARMVVSGNIFSDQYWPQSGFYGPIAHWNAGGTGNRWDGNTFRDGTPVAAPAELT